MKKKSKKQETFSSSPRYRLCNAEWSYIKSQVPTRNEEGERKQIFATSTFLQRRRMLPVPLLTVVTVDYSSLLTHSHTHTTLFKVSVLIHIAST